MHSSAYLISQDAEKQSDVNLITDLEILDVFAVQNVIEQMLLVDEHSTFR